jgi:hypothetical protein
MPASTEAVRRAGGRFDCGSIERTAILSARKIAASDHLVDAVAGGLRHQAQRVRDRAPRIVGQPRRKILILEVYDGALQRLLVGWREGDRGFGLDH